MFSLRIKKNIAITTLGILVILACKTVQINVQVNVGLTSTAATGAGDPTMAPPAISQTPAFAVVSPTGTFTSSPEPMPRLVPGQPVYIADMDMVRGWGMESSGHILHTLDGGRTWSDVTPEFSPYIAFYAADPNNAWAVSSQSGLRSLQTSNAGRSWQPGEPIDLGGINAGKCGPLHFGRVFVPQVWFIDGRQGWMVVTADAVEHGYMVSMLFSTVDAGAHWELKYLSTRDCSTSDGPEGLRSILFKTPTEGWAGFLQNKFTYYPYNQERYVGGWDLYRTTDAGSSWEAVTLPEPPGFLAETMKSENAQEVATCGVTRIVPFVYEAFGLQMRCFITPSHAFQYYYLTFNNGLDWTVWPATGGEEFVVDPYRDYKATGWRFLRSTTGGLSEIQQTLDRCRTWTTIKKVTWDSASFDFVDEQNGWAIVTTGTNTMLLHTMDEGRNWEMLAPSVSP